MSAMKVSSSFVLCTALLLTVLLPAVSMAQQVPTPAALQAVNGDLAAREPLLDPVFGFSARALGLRRNVEMWQWSEATEGGATAASYRAQWSSTAIDSSNFDADHRNPKMPFVSAQWFSDSALLNGRPVAPALLATLDDWQTQDVQLDSLPENLAAVFRVENGMLSSGEDLSRPQIGDLRISWQVLPAGPVHGYAVVGASGLDMGEGAGLIRGAAIDTDLPGLQQGARPGSDLLWWLLAALLAGALLLGVLLRRAREK